MCCPSTGGGLPARLFLRHREFVGGGADQHQVDVGRELERCLAWPDDADDIGAEGLGKTGGDGPGNGEGVAEIGLSDDQNSQGSSSMGVVMLALVVGAVR